MTYRKVRGQHKFCTKKVKFICGVLSIAALYWMYTLWMKGTFMFAPQPPIEAKKSAKVKDNNIIEFAKYFNTHQPHETINGEIIQFETSTVSISNNDENNIQNTNFDLTFPNGSIIKERFVEWDAMIDSIVQTKYEEGKSRYCAKYRCKGIPSSNETKSSSKTDIASATKDTIDDFLNNIKASSKSKTQIKTILLWNDFFGMKDWEIGLGKKPFVTHNCEVSNCNISRDRKDVNQSDAILFHINELSSEDRPSYRSENQRWVFFNMESPMFQYWQNSVYQRWDGLFNWTMTYRHDADVQVSYGGVVPGRGKGKKINYWRKKKLAVWMVSNCQTPSKRWSLYQQLSYHIDIDIFGKCGDFNCKKSNTNCWKRLGKKYKFYLSFENALCKDYITEKAFKPLLYNMVPVVYGSANYSELLPKGSYIDSNHYKTMDELATFLKSFKNDTESESRYKKYFEWRKDSHVLEYKEAYGRSWCDLCRRLNEDTDEKVYEDIAGWWGRDRDCVNATLALKKWNIKG